MVATPHCGDCFLSNDLTSFDTSATGSRKRFAPSESQSSHCSLGAVALLVSVDSLRSLLPTANDPLGHRLPLRNLSRRSGYRWRFNPLLASIDSLRSLPASQDSPLGYRFLRSPLGSTKSLIWLEGFYTIYIDSNV